MKNPVAREDAPTTLTGRLALYQRAGGALTPVVTTLVAFLLAGLVVLVTTGKNPLPVYRGILDGTGLPWLVHWLVDVRAIGGTQDLYPTEADAVAISAISLQQTLILTSTLILTALAVAFAFRSGLFNIGGQGQYLVGLLAALAVGSELTGSHAGSTSRSRSSAPPSPVLSGQGSRASSERPSAPTR